MSHLFYYWCGDCFLDDDVDAATMRTRQMSSNPNNFYGHGMDSASTRVKNVYDTGAVQNTIGTRGKILKDQQGMDTEDVIYSNERTYGQTGWNGKFVHETTNKK